MPDPFDYVDRMRSGQVPTALTFRCPACDGVALVYACRRSGDELSLSVSCLGCGKFQESDGVPKWPGWEAILVERFADELKGLKVAGWKALMATGELYLDRGTLRYRRTANPETADPNP